MGGIIVIDFIDMTLESNRELVLRRLVECLGRDRTKHQVAEAQTPAPRGAGFLSTLHFQPSTFLTATPESFPASGCKRSPAR